MPISGLFIGKGSAENGFFIEALGDDLHADGKPVGETGRDGHARDTCDVDGDSADVGHVHGDRVIDLLTEFESSGGSFCHDIRRRQELTSNMAKECELVYESHY